jgi:ribonuclease T1
MLKRYLSLFLAAALFVIVSTGTVSQAHNQAVFANPPTVLTAQLPTITVQQLPPEAKQMLKLIRQGGPFPYDKDGTVFGNREKRLPLNPIGYYHEYTVPTPGARDRGARRIITGEKQEIYYTQDHYRSFYRVKP